MQAIKAPNTKLVVPKGKEGVAAADDDDKEPVSKEKETVKENKEKDESKGLLDDREDEKAELQAGLSFQ